MLCDQRIDGWRLGTPVISQDRVMFALRNKDLFDPSEDLMIISFFGALQTRKKENC